MRIVHIIHNINPAMGGTSYALLNILRMEKHIGIDSTVVTLNADKFDPEIPKIADLIVLKPSFPARFSRSIKANQWLIQNGHKYELAVIHAIWGVLQIEASRILNKLRVPFVVWPHGSLDPFDLQKKKYLKKILGPVLIGPMLAKSEAILCTSELESERIKRYGAKSELKVLPLPVVPTESPGDRERFRNKYLLKKDDFVFLFLSRIDYKKGLNILIPAVKKNLSLYPNIKLIIAGSDSDGYQKKLQALIQLYEVGERIVMPGFLSGQDKNDAYAGSDIFVLPSMNENFGIAVVESLNAGLPVLISNNVYIWKDIIQKGGGWVCDYSINSLTKTISSILKFPADIGIKKRHAKSSAKQYLPCSLNSSYKKFYDEISNQPPNDKPVSRGMIPAVQESVF